MTELTELKGKQICVATSGGMDSTALLHYLKSKASVFGFTLSAVHCQHNIRGEESIRDEEFVRALCKAWGIPLFVYFANCLVLAKEKKMSLETVARDFRYQSFQDVIDSKKADYIATAHHQSDDAETVLFRLCRGSGLTGVKGMDDRGYILRPILDWSKQKIKEYVKEHQLAFCEDSTNLQSHATRNALRLKVFPILEEVLPSATENLVKFSRLAREDDAFLYELATKLLQLQTGKILLQFSDKKPLFYRACLMAMKTLGIEKDYTTKHLDLVYTLQQNERGAFVVLPKQVIAQKEENGIAFFIKKEEEPFVLPSEKPFTDFIFDGGRYLVTIQNTPFEEGEYLRIDGNAIPTSAVFRFKKEGDTFQSFGGKKTLKKFFNERKIPPKERRIIPLIADKNSGEVYVVCGVEIAKTVKVEKDTQSVLYIKTQKKEI